MAYATIRYGDESQYADLQRDFQRMMAQLGARRDEAARHDSDQWFRAVTGGIGSIADSAERGIVANYNRRNQLADQTSQREFATQQMRDQAALREGYGSWGDVESAAGDRGISTPELFDARDEARARAGDSRRLAFERARDADIVGRNLAQDRQMFEQDIRQAEQSAAVQNMMQPFVVSPEDEQIINTRLPTPFRDMYNKARDQERMLLSDRTLSTENRISGLAKVRDQMRNVVLHAKNAKPNPVEELQQNVQQDPRSGMWFSKGKGGEWSAIKTPEADMDADFDKQIKSILFNPQLPPEAKNAAMQNIIGARKMVNEIGRASCRERVSDTV